MGKSIWGWLIVLVMAVMMAVPALAADKAYTVGDVLQAMEVITKGRVLDPNENPLLSKNPFVVTKSSGIPGKDVTEWPGLVYGKLDEPVTKIGVVMTISECVVELAGGLGINVLVAHHPFADATNFGGVPLKNYCDLYKINLIEAHEAFHGRHPGIALIHGYKVKKADIRYAGEAGNVVFMGEAVPEVKTLGDIVARLDQTMSSQDRDRFLNMERDFWKNPDIEESLSANKPVILLGAPDSPVKNIIHIFPHTGFTAEHLEKAYRENPGLDTLICSISRVKPDHAIVAKAKELGLNLLLGNSHAHEIYENGIPLGKALEKLLPGAEIVLIEQHVTATPVNKAGNETLQKYGADMADILTVVPK